VSFFIVDVLVGREEKRKGKVGRVVDVCSNGYLSSYKKEQELQVFASGGW